VDASSCVGALDVRMNGLEVARMEMPRGRMHDSVAHKTRIPQTKRIQARDKREGIKLTLAEVSRMKKRKECERGGQKNV